MLTSRYTCYSPLLTGNLGLDCEPEKMALAQKTLIQACNLVGKPVLITRCVLAERPRPGWYCSAVHACSLSEVATCKSHMIMDRNTMLGM